jgi:hypothetical protein
MILRPGTLAEATRLHKDEDENFRFCLAGFLDAFYADMNSGSRKLRVWNEPGLAGEARFDALVGAIGEHLCRRWELGAPPPWVWQDERFLRRPWFQGEEESKGFYLAESPTAYRQRFIFTEFEPLRRARMPKDRQWWYGEELRNGWKPQSDDEIEPSWQVAFDEDSFQALLACRDHDRAA